MRKFIIFFFILIFISCFFVFPYSYSDEKCEHDCTKCHQITNDDVQTLIKEAFPDAKILEVRPAQIKGLWEISIDKNGKKGITYVDFSKKMVVSGSIFNIETKTNLTGERLSSISKIDPSQIPLEEAILMGEKTSSKNVIVFTDPECPYCKKFHNEIKKVLE